MHRRRWSGRKRDRRKANAARILEEIRIAERLAVYLDPSGDEGGGAKYFGADVRRLLAARSEEPGVRDA